MKKLNIMTSLVCIGFALGLFVSGCKKNDESGAEGQTAAEKAKEEIKEAGEATGEFLSQQKEQFMEEAQKSYAGLETQTNQLISDLRNETSEKWQQTRADLQKKLQAVKTELDELQQKSGQTWQQSKDELSAALDNLKQAYEKAKAEFQKVPDQA